MHLVAGFDLDSELSIDHIDRDTTNNKVSNLRVVTHQENCTNRSTRSDNSSGLSGVSWDKSEQTWRSFINRAGARLNLGRHNNLFDAACARKSAERNYNIKEKSHGL